MGAKWVGEDGGHQPVSERSGWGRCCPGGFLAPAVEPSPAGAGMGNRGCDDAHLLPWSTWFTRGAVSGVFAAGRVCRGSIGALPLWRGETHVRQVPGSLLPAQAPGADQGRDALCWPAHGVASSMAGASALAGWHLPAGGELSCEAARFSGVVAMPNVRGITSCPSCCQTWRRGGFCLRRLVAGL